MVLHEMTEKVMSALKPFNIPFIREYETAPLHERQERIFGIAALKECGFSEDGLFFYPEYKISLLGDSTVRGEELQKELEKLLEENIFPKLTEIKTVKIGSVGLSKILSRTELSVEIILEVKTNKLPPTEEKTVLKLSEKVSVTVEEYSAERARNRGQQLTTGGSALLWDGGQKPVSCVVKGRLSAPVDCGFLDNAVKGKQSFDFVIEGIDFPKMTLVSYSAERKLSELSMGCVLEFLSEKPTEVIKLG